MRSAKFRIALLVEDLDAPVWVRELADWATDHPLIELSAVIGCGPEGGANAFDRLLKLEQRFTLPNEYRHYASLHSIADCAPVVRIGGNSNGARDFEVDAADLSKVEELNLDAIVRCGRAHPRGAILNASRDGVISIVTADLGPGAPGFSEVLAGRPDTPFTIERLHPSAEPREILFEGSVATALLYAWNVIALQARAFPYLQLVLERLASGDVESRLQAHVEAPDVRPGSILRYGVRTAKRSAAKAVRRCSGQEFNWQVAFLRGGWEQSQFEHGRVIPNPPGTFLADPFTVNVGGRDYLFVEEFPFETRKGVISAYEIDKDAARRIGVVLEEPYHLSFPFVFEHAGEIYMVPEAGAGRAITLYKSSGFPGSWSPVKVLMADVPAVDTVLFQHGSLWWMLTTIQGKGPGLNNAELHAFYAPDLFGDWVPHRQNPVVMSARKGRNGGLLQDKDGAQCRVAQAPGFTFYGAGSAIYRIDELTPDVYRESLIREVHPDFFPNLDGTHHIHSSGNLTVYDFMRVERAAG